MTEHGIEPREFERRVAREQRFCAHFNGLCYDRCKAGVRYAEVRLESPGSRTLYPCVDLGARGRCASLSLPTRDEAVDAVLASHAEMTSALAAAAAAHEDAARRGLGRGSGGVGECACTKCGTGSIRYAVAASNGHMSARCTTPGCVAWME